MPVPLVLGDEGSGIVEAAGAGVRGVREGDHVVLSWSPTCGLCHYCVIGRPVLGAHLSVSRAVADRNLHFV